jgi:hypothetical protein
MPDDLSWAVSAKHRSLQVQPRIRHVSDCLAVRGRAHGKATSTGMFTCSLFGIGARCYRRKGHRATEVWMDRFFFCISLSLSSFWGTSWRTDSGRELETSSYNSVQQVASDEPMPVLFTIGLAPEITTMISRTNIHKHRCCLLAPDTLPSLGDWLCHF